MSRTTAFAGIVLTGLLVAGCAGTPKETQYALARGDQNSTDPHRIICKEASAPTGSRIESGQVCHTADQWAALEARAQQTVRQGVNSNAGSGFMH